MTRKHSACVSVYSAVGTSERFTVDSTVTLVLMWSRFATVHRVFKPLLFRFDVSLRRLCVTV